MFFTDCIFSEQKEITCHLEGTVIGRDSNGIVLLKATDDIRFSGISIPINDGKFEYELKLPETEAYFLAFKEEVERGAYDPILFFPEDKEVRFKLYSSDEFTKNTVVGGKLNKEPENYNLEYEKTFMPRLEPLYESINMLRENDEYYTDSAKIIRKKLSDVKDMNERYELLEKRKKFQKKDGDKTPEAIAINNQKEAIMEEAIQWRYEYINKNRSLLYYYFLLKDLMGIKYNNVSIVNIYENYTPLSETYPNILYSAIMQNLLEAVANIQVGENYIDFTAPNLDGDLIKLSDVIKEKVAIIDLWASWCGPCIAKSRTMIPVFEDFHDKGFTIIGVAREFENTEKLEKRLAIENYPWLNLIELDDQNAIWQKYGIPNGGGTIFLADKNGKNLAINPTADKVREKLGKLL